MKMMHRLTKATLALGALLLGCPFSPNSSHTIQIDRVFANVREEELIRKAESVCPQYQDVASLFAVAPPPEDSDNCLWWYNDGSEQSLEYVLPFSITSDAIEYYSNLIAQWDDQGDRCFAHMEYTAMIDYGGQYVVGDLVVEGGIAVTLRLFFERCGTTFFSKHRIVIFDEQDEIQYVFGDGATESLVS